MPTPPAETADSRIAADWTLPAETAAPTPAVPIDTSTTAGKIAVMEAAARGEMIEYVARIWTSARREWRAVGRDCGATWNWEEYDYRIAPAPASRTALQRTRAYLQTHSDASLEELVAEIDRAPTLTLEAGPKRNLHWGAIDPNTLQPGRYRLVADPE